MGIIHDLRVTPYSFSATVGSLDDRFVLRYKNQDTTLENATFTSNENDIIVFTSENLAIKSASREIESIQIHDILGRNLTSINQVNAKEITISSLQKNNAPLLLQIKVTDGTVINRKVIF